MSVDVRGNRAARRFSGLSEIGRAPRPCSVVARRSHRQRCTPGASSVRVQGRHQASGKDGRMSAAGEGAG
jgi:hypothetical protein